MSVIISYETDTELDLDYKSIIEKVVLAAIEYVNCPFPCEVNVEITDNDGIKDINNNFRDIDKETDVLSFPAVEFDRDDEGVIFPEGIEGDFSYFNPDTSEMVLGDILISADKVISQADEYGHSKERELAFLTAHSMFHLFGYDHMQDDERCEMEDMQKDLLDKLGFVRG